jgi:hypothetical protein
LNNRNRNEYGSSVINVEDEDPESDVEDEGREDHDDPAESFHDAVMNVEEDEKQRDHSLSFN